MLGRSLMKWRRPAKRIDASTAATHFGEMEDNHQFNPETYAEESSLQRVDPMAGEPTGVKKSAG